MVIDKKYKGLIDEGWRYKIEGNIATTEGLEIDLDKGLYIKGFIKAGWYIKAGRFIEAGGYIEAGRSIKAGGSIEAGGYIEAGRSIKAGRFIEAGGSIEAGGFIEAGWSIEAGRSIKAGGSIEAGGFIEAGWSIEAGEYIKAGESYGIIAGLSVTCKTTLTFGLKAFAGICTWKEITDEEKTITCGKLDGGVVEYGILKEVGLSEEKTESMIEIDGKKYGENTIKEALKEYVS